MAAQFPDMVRACAFVRTAAKIKTLLLLTKLICVFLKPIAQGVAVQLRTGGYLVTKTEINAELQAIKKATDEFFSQVRVFMKGLYPDEVARGLETVSYTHLRAHETVLDLVC